MCNGTKQKIAYTMHEMMGRKSFEKITVKNLMDVSNMNRQSFYYHFQDKYELLNWIFDTEIISFMQTLSETDQFGQRIEVVQDVCVYFYENRNFYRKALKIEGQNSFSEHFREYIKPILKGRLSVYLIGDQIDDFTVNFFTDAAVCAVERWLLDKNCMPPDLFVDKMLYLVQRSTETLYKELNK